MRKTVLFLSILLVAITSHAQEDIFKKHGFNKEPLTLSKGKYKETFTNEDMMQIGTVLIDTRTEKVIKFLEEDTTRFAYKAETTSRFLTVDPLAEKYYNWSPYVYCMNNPVKYIDPDGRKIVIVTGNKEYTYNGKNVTSSTGKAIDVPTNTHLGRAVQAYNAIRNSGDPVLAGKVQHLMNSENTHYIVDKNPGQSPNSVQAGSKKTTVSQDKANIEAGKGISSTTLFDFSEKNRAELEASMGISSEDSETVAHELQHQFDYDTGNQADSYGKPSTATNPAEIRAVNNENRMRKVNSSEKRTTYGGKPIDPKKLEP